MIRETTGSWERLDDDDPNVKSDFERWEDGRGRWVPRPWRFRAPGVSEMAWSDGEYQAHRAASEHTPCMVARTDDLRHYVFEYRERFYLTDLEADQEEVANYVKVRAARREREREVLSTQAAALASNPNGRVPIPREVRYAVWERDGGKCAECGSSFDLQYDHIIPVSRGGASTVGNLQILCGDCNRRKGATLG